MANISNLEGFIAAWTAFQITACLLLLFFLLYNIVLVLPYINLHPPRVYTCSPSWIPLPPHSPYRHSGSSQCTSPEHPVSCIEPGLAIHFIYDIIHVAMPFSQIIPPSPSPTKSNRLFYKAVSLLLSHIQGCRYHLSKFHVYVLVYGIGNRTAIRPSNPTAMHTHWGNQNWKRHVYPNVHHRTVCNSQDMEAT